MNCIAIEDNPSSADLVKEICNKTDYLNFIGTYKDSYNSLSEIFKNKIDVVFFDIEKPNLSCLEFIKSLTNPPLIVFTNTSSKHANNCFELEAANRLPGSISFNNFIKVVNETSVVQPANDKDFTSGNNTPKKSAVQANRQTSETDNAGKYLFVKVDYSTVKVSFDEIKFIEGLKDYIKIFIGEKSLVTKSTIKHIESKLPAYLFTRVHKSYVVSIDKIDKIEYNHIFIGQNKIPIGMQFKNSFYERIDYLRL